MDEDEWTEQNFGGNSLVLNENTSEDSVSDLDSDEEGDEDDEENDKKPLTAKEARQLQRAWLKQRMDDIRNGASDPEMSQYDNVKDLHRYVLRFFQFSNLSNFHFFEFFGNSDFRFLN